MSDMTCFAAKVWQPVKQTVAPKESCLYVFDQCFHSYFIFLNSKDIFLPYKQLTCLQKLYLTSKNSFKEYFVERKQIKSITATNSKLRIFGGKTCSNWVQSCLHQIRTCFFLTCKRLDATDGICYCATKHWLIKKLNRRGDIGADWNRGLAQANPENSFNFT